MLNSLRGEKSKIGECSQHSLSLFTQWWSIIAISELKYS